MDTLYIADIPSEYHYAQFSNNYVTLYNTSVGYNNILHYYRLYFTDMGYFYSQGEQQFSSYNATYFTDIPVSNDWTFRHDIDKIFVVCFIIFLMFIWLFNLVTSCIKKGGVFGGLF